MSLDLILTSPWFLPALFFIVAVAYSSVGLGGGSSYTALMAIVGMSSLAIPMVSLSLNLMVTTISSYNFLRNGHGRIKLILPFLLSSMPMAYLGGSLDIHATVFYWVLLVSLLFVAARIYFLQSTSLRLNLNHTQKIMLSLLAGSILGLIAGIVGIGGGIYLVPLIIVLGLGSEKQAAACGAIFVWLNSLAGLASRIQHNAIDLTDYMPLIAAALIGGSAGSFFGSFKASPKVMEKILGIIIIVAIVLLMRKLVNF